MYYGESYIFSFIWIFFEIKMGNCITYLSIILVDCRAVRSKRSNNNIKNNIIHSFIYSALFALLLKTAPKYLSFIAYKLLINSRINVYLFRSLTLHFYSQPQDSSPDLGKTVEIGFQCELLAPTEHLDRFTDKKHLRSSTD